MIFLLGYGSENAKTIEGVVVQILAVHLRVSNSIVPEFDWLISDSICIIMMNKCVKLRAITCLKICLRKDYFALIHLI